jgi:hypothetical protein
LNGGSTTTLTDMRFGAGVTVAGTDAATTPNDVTLTNVTVAKVLTATLGNSNPAVVTVTGSTLGGLVETGNVVGALVTGSTIKGPVSVKGMFQADLTVDATTVTGAVTVSAALPSFRATNAGSTLNSNLTLIGSSWTNTTFESTTLTEVKGSVLVTGGWFSDQFTTNSLFKAAKAVNLNLKGGDNTVSIGDGTAAVSVGGALTVRGAAGVDTVTLDRVAVAGATLIATLQGADVLTIDGGATFTGTFTADLGTGEDTIAIAQNTGSTGAVTFTGNAKILGGAGNDTLLLGMDPGAGGDANSRAVFNGLTDVIDGGLGIDVFDTGSAQFTGASPIGWNP